MPGSSSGGRGRTGSCSRCSAGAETKEGDAARRRDRCFADAPSRPSPGLRRAQARADGSTARDEARPDSDLDLLVEYETSPTLDNFVGLKLFLEDHFGVKVDLVTPDGLKPRTRPGIERDAVEIA